MTILSIRNPELVAAVRELIAKNPRAGNKTVQAFLMARCQVDATINQVGGFIGRLGILRGGCPSGGRANGRHEISAHAVRPPSKVPDRSGWRSPERDAIVLIDWPAGVPVGEITKKLNMLPGLPLSPAAVRNMAHELRTLRPASFLTRDYKAENSARAARSGADVEARVNEAAQKAHDIKITATVITAVPPRPPRAPKPIVAPPPPRLGRVTECCWPIGETKPYRFCDAPSAPGRPYCEQHVRKAFERPSRREAGISLTS